MPDDDDPLLDDYLDEWLKRRSTQLRPATMSCYRRTIDAYLRPHLGSKQLSRLDRRTLETLYIRLLASGGRDGQRLSPRTVELAHTVLHGALKDAHVDGLIAANPAEHATPPKRDPYAVDIDDDLEVWTAEQTARFLTAVDGHRRRALWHLAVGTGARRAELLGLRWKDVDLDDGTVAIRRALTVIDRTPRLLGTKTSQCRVLSIGASVVDALRQRHQEQTAHKRAAGDSWRDQWGLVLTHPDGRNLHPDVVTMEFRDLVLGLDLPVITLHGLRHTHASLLLEQGVTMKVISERLGHAGITITMDTYAHLLPAMDHDAARAFDAQIHRNGR